MGVLAWVFHNAFELISSVGIIGGLFYNALTRLDEIKSRKVSNFIALTANHFEIWKELLSRPEYERVLDPTIDVSKTPVTPTEHELVNFVVLHLSCTFYATKNGIIIQLEKLSLDAKVFFSLPIPRAVWEKTKVLQNDDFVEFVESVMHGK